MTILADTQTTRTQVDAVPAAMRDSRDSLLPAETEDREPSAFAQGLPLVLSIAVTLALAFAFIAGQWLSTGGSVGLA